MEVIRKNEHFLSFGAFEDREHAFTHEGKNTKTEAAGIL
jgi:hypothetical protein